VPARTYSGRLGTIGDEQFQAALDHFALGRLIATTPITRGLFGQNVFLQTSVGSFVLRGSPHDATQLHHERCVCRLLHERTGIPVPWPYLIDESATIFGWSYALMPRMPGIHIDDASRPLLGPADGTAIAQAMGMTLAQLGDVEGPAGAYDRASDGIVPDPSAGFDAERWIRGCVADANAFDPATFNPHRDWVDGIIMRGLEALERSCPTTLTTSDFGEGNAVVQKHADGRWHVSGIFDFYEYGMGDLERALCRPLFGYLAQSPALALAFLRGYAQRRPLRPFARERLAFYALGDRFIIWNYGHSQAPWFPPELGFRDFAEPALRQIDDVLVQVGS